MKKFIIFLLAIFLINLSIYSKEKIVSLKESMELARKQNPNLVAEIYNVEIAKGEVINSRLLPNPVFNNQELVRAGSLGATYGVIPTTNGLAISETAPGHGSSRLGALNRQDWFQITMQIPVAGQRQKAFELALKNLELTKNNLAEFQRNILFLVANKWGDAWISSQRLGILKKAKQYSDDLLTTNELRYKKEAITLAEFNRTQIIAEQYNALLDLEEQVFKNELRLLKALTGSEEQMIIKEEDSSGTELLEIDIDLMISDALKNRSDILSGKIAEELSRKDLILQEAKAYPRPEIGFIYNPQNTDPYMGTFLTIPLPVFNRNQGEILRAKSELEQKAKKLNAIEIQIDTEVRNAFAEYSVAKRNYEKYKNIYKISEKVLDTVKYSYLRGGTTIVDYLEAQRNWFETQNLYYNSIFNLRRTFILLIFSNGRILEY